MTEQYIAVTVPDADGPPQWFIAKRHGTDSGFSPVSENFEDKDWDWLVTVLEHMNSLGTNTPTPTALDAAKAKATAQLSHKQYYRPLSVRMCGEE